MDYEDETSSDERDAMEAVVNSLVVKSTRMTIWSWMTVSRTELKSALSLKISHVGFVLKYVSLKVVLLYIQGQNMERKQPH
jgi:hypothetical protein